MAADIAQAVALWRGGRPGEAEAACLRLIAVPGCREDAHSLLAEIYATRREFARAAGQLRRLTALRPADASAHRRLGDSLFAAGSYRDSAEAFRRAIELDPRSPRAHNNLGRALFQLDDCATAIESYRQAVSLDPAYAIAHNNLGIALGGSGRPEEAITCYERAISLNPRFAEAHGNLANALFRLDRNAEALAGFERALALDPSNDTILCNCAGALLKLGRLEDALACCERVLGRSPACIEAQLGRGNVLREMRRADAALAAYERVIELQPYHLLALSNRASTLLELNRHLEAVECCERILELRPDFPAALLFRGLAYSLMGRMRYEEAVRSFERLWKASPTEPYALGYLLHASTMICDWSYTGLVPEALRAVATGQPVSQPFSMLALSDSTQVQLECARTFVNTTHPPAPQPVWSGRRWQNRRIRVAYLSGDLRNHALSYLMVGVFEKHDREQFEVYGVSFREPENLPFGVRVLGALDAFLDVQQQSDAQVAQILHEMQIDIAVDLMGFTRGQRINIFANRAAPVQVSYLGYPATTGAPYLDYVIADEFVIPPALQANYAEKVVYLPDCYQANDDRRLLAATRPSRAAAGLPETGFIFCCFNSGYKITPVMFDLWCRLLAARPGSVLWLLAESEPATHNLALEAARRGIPAGRIVFAGRASYEEHLARLQLADLFLDTLPFNAGTTASDALWAGLPVLTCAGEAFAARMAGSLLRAVGLPELISNDLGHYENLALRLSAAPSELAALRARLAENRATHPLFDTERFCRHLESAYRTMHERAQRGEPPAGFHVAAQFPPTRPRGTAVAVAVAV
jgi:predicted O-linked N-acetylglucosamine transferase (SPINDLY family)